MRKIVVIGTNTIHTYNFISLIEDHFDDVLLITNELNSDSSVKAEVVDFSLTLSNLVKTPKRIKELVKDFKPSVVHIHQANSVAFHAFRSDIDKNIPTILTAWGSDILVLPKKNWLLKKMVQSNLSKADYFTSDSVFMADEMRRLIKKPIDILVANFGINVDFEELPKENIIYSNRLHKPLYNIDKIIQAFHDFQLSLKDWKLVVAAVGEETDHLKKQVADLKLTDKVSFVGWVKKEENSTWYSKARIWVSIPDSDATAISLLEAMACGCLPVVSDLPASKEWVTDGENGIVVKQDEKDFLSRALSCDFEKAKVSNKIRIEKDGLKSANKLKFISLYNQILTKENHK